MSLLRIPLVRIAHARSGDKADWVDFGLFVWNEAGYRMIDREVTAERVQAHFAPWLPCEIEAWPLPNILALKFVLKGALQGGGAQPAAGQPGQIDGGRLAAAGNCGDAGRAGAGLACTARGLVA